MAQYFFQVVSGLPGFTLWFSLNRGGSADHGVRNFYVPRCRVHQWKIHNTRNVLEEIPRERRVVADLEEAAEMAPTQAGRGQSAISRVKLAATTHASS